VNDCFVSCIIQKLLAFPCILEQFLKKFLKEKFADVP
jgi:hypothetical protein